MKVNIVYLRLLLLLIFPISLALFCHWVFGEFSGVTSIVGVLVGWLNGTSTTARIGSTGARSVSPGWVLINTVDRGSLSERPSIGFGSSRIVRSVSPDSNRLEGRPPAKDSPALITDASEGAGALDPRI